MFQFIKHIECHHHRQVHVDELGGKEKVSFQIGGIHDVEHHIGMVVEHVLAHVEFLGCVFGKGVGAGQVGDLDGVILVFEDSNFGINSHAAVIAHLLAHASGVVEKGGLATVGVADQRHGDGLAALAQDASRLLGDGTVEAVTFSCLISQGDHLNMLGLNAPQGDMALHDLILNGIAQGGVLDDAYLLATYEAQFHQPVTKAAVTAQLHNHTL